MTIAVHERNRCSAGCFSTSERRREPEGELALAYRTIEQLLSRNLALEAELATTKAELARREAGNIPEHGEYEISAEMAAVQDEPENHAENIPGNYSAGEPRWTERRTRPIFNLRNVRLGDFVGMEMTDERAEGFVVWLFRCANGCGAERKISTGAAGLIRGGNQPEPRCFCPEAQPGSSPPACESASEADDDQFVFGVEPEGPPPAPVLRALPPEPPEPGTRRRGRPPKREPTEFEVEDNPERGEIAPIDEALDELAAGDVDELPSVRPQDEHTFTRLRDRFADETEDEDDGLDDVNTGARVLPYRPDATPAHAVRHDERPVELLDEDDLLDEAMRLFEEERVALG